MWVYEGCLVGNKEWQPKVLKVLQWTQFIEVLTFNIVFFSFHCSPHYLGEPYESPEAGERGLEGCHGGGKGWKLESFVSCLCITAPEELGMAQ